MRIEATTWNRAGELALEIYRQTLEQIRGDRLVEAKVHLQGDELAVDDLILNLREYDRIFVCGAGKPSPYMAQGLLNILGDRVSGGLVVTKHGHGMPLGPIRVMEAGHPVPDEASLEAGEAMLDFASRTTEKDLVLFVLSGGASALMEALESGLSLADIQAVSRELLSSGATIMTMNAIRSRLSRVKVGGLARAFRAQVVCLVMSDVKGNRLNVIGSGPFVGEERAFDLEPLLRSFGFGRTFPSNVLSLLSTTAPSATAPNIEHRIVGDARVMGELAAEAARNLGLNSHFHGIILSRDGREAVESLDVKGQVPDLPSRMNFSLNCLIEAGEATIVVRGTGLGGRAQEMAMVAARKIVGHANLVWLVAGSDGTDGPTDAAGAMVDGETVARAAAKGFDYESGLADNDSYHFHEAAGTLIKTGPTGSNLNDLVIVVDFP